MTRSIVSLVEPPGFTGGAMEHMQQPGTLMWEAVGGVQPIDSKKGRARPTHKRHKSWRRVDSLADLTLPLSLGETLERLTAESFMLVGLAFKLFSYLGLGWKWLYMLCRLVMFATFLLPGFIQMIVYYFTSPQVLRSVPYGRKPRQRLDLYVPKGAGDGCQVPVVIFITGGAWTIGYKAWGALLGRRLCEQGIMVACLDYRNFPQGSALQMLEDVNTGIAWVVRKIERYGGDPDSTYLVGQSAGGQLAMLALLNQASQAVAGEAVLGAAPVWHPLDIKGFVGVSGAYDLEGLEGHLHKRGLYKSLLGTIMSVDGKPAYEVLSPLHAARCANDNLHRYMPPCLLMHGTVDNSVPFASTLLMNDAMQEAGIDSTFRLFEGKSHTRFLLEDPMGGGRDYLTDTILEVITGHEHVTCHQLMCPKVLVALADWVCPF